MKRSLRMMHLVLVVFAFAMPAMAADKPKEVQLSPVTAFKDGFTLEQSKKFRNERDLSAWLGGGDASVWVNLRPAEAFPATALALNRLPAKALPTAINPAIGKIKVETKNFGTLSLDEYMAHPKSRAQAFMVVHKGRIVYENYPGIYPPDYHLWMSCAKVIAGLVVDQLISEGKIDEKKTIGNYVPEFRGSAWENVSVKDVMDMTPGLNTEEETNGVSYAPGSIANRVLLSEFGMPYNGKQEILLDVLRDAKKVREPGSQFDYSSPATQVLVFLAEAVTGERWAQSVDKRIWSKLGAEAPLLMHTTPEGVAVGHGMVSSRLSDFARFGMLYTPSWNKVATERVVSSVILERIQKGVRSKEFFLKGFGPHEVSHLNDDTMISNSRQWDAIWPDGDMFKAGFQTQALYVSPARDLVIVLFSVNRTDDSVMRYLRPIATSGLFDK